MTDGTSMRGRSTFTPGDGHGPDHADLLGQLPRFMGYFEDHLKANGGRFLCAEHVTIADLAALHAILYYKKGIADHVPKTSLDAFPAITDWAARVMQHPPVAAFYAQQQK